MRPPMLAHWDGEPVEILRSLWDVPRLEVHASLASTNDRAEALRREGAPAFTTVLAEEQTEGRGRTGSRWISEAGRGVWLSLLAPATRGESGTAVLPLLAGLAVARAVEEAVTGVRAGVEWPNDVLVAGRKVAGVLCERGSASGSASLAVVGIGVNVRAPDSEPAPEIRREAGGLEEAAGGRISRVRFTGSLLRHCRDLLDGAGLDASGTELAPGVREDLSARDVLRGGTVETDGGVRGLGRGIDPDGALLLELGDGTVYRVRSGRLIHRRRGAEKGADDGGVGTGTEPGRGPREEPREGEEACSS